MLPATRQRAAIHQKVAWHGGDSFPVTRALRSRPRILKAQQDVAETPYSGAAGDLRPAASPVDVEGTAAHQPRSS